jgi:hypothetical protein
VGDVERGVDDDSFLVAGGVEVPFRGDRDEDEVVPDSDLLAL